MTFVIGAWLGAPTASRLLYVRSSSVGPVLLISSSGASTPGDRGNRQQSSPRRPSRRHTGSGAPPSAAERPSCATSRGPSIRKSTPTQLLAPTATAHRNPAVPGFFTVL